MEITYKEEHFHSLEELKILVETMTKDGFDLIECVAPKAIFRKVSRT